MLEEAGGARVDSLAELLSGEADGERIAAQIGAAIGLTQEPTRPDELFPAIRRFFEAVADRQPLVVVLEDVHWAEATFLDLIEYLADAAREPLFLLCLARPELLEARPAWEAASETSTPCSSSRSTRARSSSSRNVGGRSAVPDSGRVVALPRQPMFAEQLVPRCRTHAVPSRIPARSCGAPRPDWDRRARLAAMRRDRNVIRS